MARCLWDSAPVFLQLLVSGIDGANLRQEFIVKVRLVVPEDMSIRGSECYRLLYRDV